MKVDARLASIQPNDEIGRLLKIVPLLSKLSDTERAKLGGAVIERNYSDGQRIITQGEPGNGFFIIRKGAVAVSRTDEKGIKHEVHSKHHMHCNTRACAYERRQEGDTEGTRSCASNNHCLKHTRHSPTPTPIRMISLMCSLQLSRMVTSLVRIRNTYHRFTSSTTRALYTPLRRHSNVCIPFICSFSSSFFSVCPGETALINDAKRGATVTSTGPVATFYLERDDFEALFGRSRLNVQFAKRQAISAEQVKSGAAAGGGAVDGAASTSAPPNAIRDKDHAAVHMISSVMKDNVVFMNLDAENKAQIIAEMWKSTIPAGVSAVRQGDLGDCLYVIASGEFDVFVNDRKVAVRGKGTMFGELALMYNSPRAATVRANQDSVVWMIDRFTFRRIVTGLSVQKFDVYVKFLKNVQLLVPLADYERKKIAEALEEVSFAAGHTVFKQNEVGDAMYIVYQGEVKILKDDSEVMRCKVGDYFGERALLTSEGRAASAVTASPVQLLKLDRNAFSLLLGPLEDIMKSNAEKYNDTTKGGGAGDQSNDRDSDEPSVDEVRRRQQAALARAKNLPQIQFSNLRVLGTLGKGSFGFVQLVQDKTTEITYALKAVSKAQIVQTGQQGHVMSEKKAMMLFDHPFLIKLFATYKDRNRVRRHNTIRHNTTQTHT